MPIAISVNMLRLRVPIDCQPRTKNGQPAHSTTGVARTSSTQPSTSGENASNEPGRQVPAHRDDHDRDREHGADDEAPAHVEIVLARALVAGHHLRLERHAADRAAAGTLLPHLRMHRAGVDRILGTGRGRLGFAAIEIARRRRFKLLAAARRAEEIRRATVIRRCFALAGSTLMPHTGSRTRLKSCSSGG